jgi:hypothetical protein
MEEAYACLPKADDLTGGGEGCAILKRTYEASQSRLYRQG